VGIITALGALASFYWKIAILGMVLQKNNK
jgi:hypothetical protein